MTTQPQIPIPKDPRHQRYADGILAGLQGQAAYRQAFLPSTPSLTKESANTGHKRLKNRADIIAYIRAVRAASAANTVLSVKEKREFLARIVRVPITVLDIEKTKDGDLIKSFTSSETESTKSIRLEKHDPLKAIEIDNRLAGDDPTTSLLSDLAEALQSLPKPDSSTL